MNKLIKILAIETSCDETAAAVVVNGTTVLSNIIATQMDLHKKYGGVVPEIASRKHVENISQVIQQAMNDANLEFKHLDAIAVTYAPGLVGALLVGVAEAKAMAFALQKPLIGIHHIEGHISANYIEHPELKPPFISLVVSGGHTHLVLVKDYGCYEVLGATRDDAVGEAYDKVARVLGLGYPGGPKIDKLAEQGDSKAIHFPRIYLEKDSLDFSLSGLKSAVLNYINQSEMKGEEINKADVAASFQEAIVEVLIKKTIIAATKHKIDAITLAGGVAANQKLRYELKLACENEGLRFICPSHIYCTDNAAMIGCAAYYEYQKGVSHALTLNAIPYLKIGSR